MKKTFELGHEAVKNAIRQYIQKHENINPMLLAVELYQREGKVEAVVTMEAPDYDE